MCKEEMLLMCMQFMLCPTDANGANEDCTKAPRVINNSWSSGIANNPVYKDAITAWRAAGIIPVFSNGNLKNEQSQTQCSTVASPADYGNVISVGWIDNTGQASPLSAKGPSLNTRAMKPDLVAPGTSILSASRTGNSRYEARTGSSMSAPHVTGTIALLLSRDPTMTYDSVYAALTQKTSVTLLQPAPTTCGSPSVPNNIFGFGIVNAQQALNLATLETTSPVPTPTSTPMPTIGSTPEETLDGTSIAPAPTITPEHKPVAA